ncbi:GntR family transcriptional regulator [Camelliibacillus cellulosilyticus]|uniref:GntR family transcriptional regulator n=1 Tax=Camelliibacillus cellulosilyticus TaxID=2174486 RepID=A0ABV9GKX1_9BACL
MIDKRSPVPIYYQIEAYIKDMIEANRLGAGDAIPSEREFTEKFQVSRMTVRQAITNLVNDGYLYRQKGKGTFVADKKIEQPLQGLTSFTEDMKRRGMLPATRLLDFSIVPAGRTVAARLQVKDNEAIYKIKRIRLADDKPMALEETYIPTNLVPDLTRDIVQQSLYSHIEKDRRLRIANGDQVIEAAIAGGEETQYLHIAEGDPILLIHRHTFLQDGRPLEWVKSIYRADRYKFVISMIRD